ncbi:MAG: NAD-dependent deacylase [bacterium]
MEAAIRDALGKIRDGLEPTTRIATLTGAGISAASGIPTFRGEEDSLWENYRPEELATPQAFHRDPELVWRWYDWRRGLIAAAEPNAAHAALVSLEDHVAEVIVITQNVDGLHDRAGSEQVLEFHGSIWRLRCLGCGREDEDLRVPVPIPPHCESCGGLLRPGVVWFGEGIDEGVMRASATAADRCDLFLVIGTSGAVYPAAGLVQVAQNSGAHVLEFNIERSGISADVDLFVPGSADETLPLLLP